MGKKLCICGSEEPLRFQDFDMSGHEMWVCVDCGVPHVYPKCTEQERSRMSVTDEMMAESFLKVQQVNGGGKVVVELDSVDAELLQELLERERDRRDGIDFYEAKAMRYLRNAAPPQLSHHHLPAEP